MFVDTIDNDTDIKFESKPLIPNSGSDGVREYTLLGNAEFCKECFKYTKLKEFGIEKISYSTYQLAKEKFFDLQFNVFTQEGKITSLKFSHKFADKKNTEDFFTEVKNKAIAANALGLSIFAGQLATIGSRHYIPPAMDSAYLRCTTSCDDIDHEVFRLICYALCLFADDTPGT